MEIKKRYRRNALAYSCDQDIKYLQTEWTLVGQACMLLLLAICSFCVIYSFIKRSIK